MSLFKGDWKGSEARQSFLADFYYGKNTGIFGYPLTLATT